jgi:acyl-coenzyme A synthetase/AMP-(fatty) acid ligase
VIAAAEFPKTASMKVKREQLAAALRAQVAGPEPLLTSFQS